MSKKERLKKRDIMRRTRERERTLIKLEGDIWVTMPTKLDAVIDYGVFKEMSMRWT